MAHFLLAKTRDLGCRNAVSPQTAGVFWVSAPVQVPQVRLLSMLRWGYYAGSALQGFHGGGYSLADACCQESKIGFGGKPLDKSFIPQRAGGQEVGDIKLALDWLRFPM